MKQSNGMAYGQAYVDDTVAAPVSDEALVNEPPTSVHTSNFPEILRYFGISLAVTTYQAGKLIFIRAENDVINTHFRNIPRPMGMHADSRRLIVGAAREIVEYANVPNLTAKLDPPHVNDACYILRKTHVTGDIDIHEMVHLNDGLHFVNTRFSTLCALEDNYSFKTTWVPPFITALAPEDRCHLNGICPLLGRPKYVTALATTDTPQGWRDHKKDGGVMMDIDSSQVVLEGLSMPHSPRIYENSLWIQESGQGSFGRVDLQSRRYEPIVTLDGFTRGVDFAGNLAFIGLSQIRESAIFGGVPIAERLKDKERMCGVWVVDIRNGDTVAFLKFTGGVREVFAVSVLPDMVYPEILEPDHELMASTYTLADQDLQRLSVER